MSIPENVTKLQSPKTKLQVLNSMKKRFSPRVFSSEPVAKLDLDIIFEAARLAPSGRNHQPWFFYFTLVGTPEFEKLFTCIPERNMWSKTAAAMVVACYDPTEPKDGVNKWALYDLGAAVLSMVLQATELGYSCRQIGSFDCDKTKREFSIPDPFIPFTLIAMGMMGSEEDYQKADPEIVEKELQPNPRKAVISQDLSSLHE